MIGGREKLKGINVLYRCLSVKTSAYSKGRCSVNLKVERSLLWMPVQLQGFNQAPAWSNWTGIDSKFLENRGFPGSSDTHQNLTTQSDTSLCQLSLFISGIHPLCFNPGPSLICHPIHLPYCQSPHSTTSIQPRSSRASKQ